MGKPLCRSSCILSAISVFVACKSILEGIHTASSATLPCEETALEEHRSLTWYSWPRRSAARKTYSGYMLMESRHRRATKDCRVTCGEPFFSPTRIEIRAGTFAKGSKRSAFPCLAYKVRLCDRQEAAALEKAGSRERDQTASVSSGPCPQQLSCTV